MAYGLLAQAGCGTTADWAAAPGPSPTPPAVPTGVADPDAQTACRLLNSTTDVTTGLVDPNDPNLSAIVDAARSSTTALVHTDGQRLSDRLAAWRAAKGTSNQDLATLDVGTAAMTMAADCEQTGAA
ncbi:hypothetical protein [Rugosimonospora acidiphila]